MEKNVLRKLSAIFAFVCFIVMVVVNGLANGLPLNGVNTGQLSDDIPNLFVPAGVTFSIWGLIYALLLGYVLFTLIAAFSKKQNTNWQAPDGLLFSINALCNAAWIFAWHWRLIGLSVVIMFCILATLIILLERGYKKSEIQKTSKVQNFFLWQPLLVYLGWICVATIANITALLVTLGWNGFGIPELWWTVFVIIVGTVIGISLVLKRGAVASGLVFIWAYAGIVLKRNSVDPSQTMPIIVAAIVGAILVLASIKIAIISNRRILKN